MEGDTTNFCIFKKLKEASVKVSTIARGIALVMNWNMLMKLH